MENQAEAVEILLVEDNPEDVEFTTRSLKKQNLANRLLVVKDGAEALDYIFRTGAYSNLKEKDAPKVVLLDLKLPKVSGIEVLRKMKEDPAVRSIPVVVLTSSDDEPDIKICYDLGANSYIVKPVDFDKFMKTVSDIGLYWLVINKRSE